MCSGSSYFFRTGPLNIMKRITYKRLPGWGTKYIFTPLWLYVMIAFVIWWYVWSDWQLSTDLSFDYRDDKLRGWVFFSLQRGQAHCRTNDRQATSGQHSGCSWGSFTFTLSLNSITSQAHIWKTAVPLVKHRLSVAANNPAVLWERF